MFLTEWYILPHIHGLSHFLLHYSSVMLAVQVPSLLCDILVTFHTTSECGFITFFCKFFFSVNKSSSFICQRILPWTQPVVYMPTHIVIVVHVPTHTPTAMLLLQVKTKMVPCHPDSWADYGCGNHCNNL